MISPLSLATYHDVSFKRKTDSENLSSQSDIVCLFIQPHESFRDCSVTLFTFSGLGGNMGIPIAPQRAVYCIHSLLRSHVIIWSFHS